MAKTTVPYKLGFRNQKPARKIEICRGLVAGLGQLPPEKRELVHLATLEGKLAAAESAVSEVVTLRAQMRAALSRRSTALREMCRTADRSASAHAGDVKFDPAQMLAGGLLLPAPVAPVGRAGAPERLRAERGQFARTVVLRWKRPVRRCIFIVEATTDPNGQEGWVRVHHCTAAKCVLKDLESGRQYWFRVAALNAHGEGPWSQMVTLRPE